MAGHKRKPARPRKPGGNPVRTAHGQEALHRMLDKALRREANHLKCDPLTGVPLVASSDASRPDRNTRKNKPA